MNRASLSLMVFTAAATAASAADPALHERIPPGVTPDPAQRKIAEELAAKVYELEVEYDADGQVTRLLATVHEVRRKARKIAEERKGITDADAPLLAKFPRLRGVCFEKQPITEKGPAVLKDLPLTDVRLHSMPPGIDPHFATVVNGKPLTVLHVKHNFWCKPDVSELGGFPDLKYLVLDTTAAGPACVDFVAKCPKVEIFELHRPRITGEQFARLCVHLPSVRWMEIKPDIGGAGSLNHLQKAPKLEALMLSQWKAGTLPFENGLEHLAGVKSLKYLIASGAKPDAIAKLKALRPDLKVCPADGPFPEHVDSEGTRYQRISPPAPSGKEPAGNE
jgi:hypothetical protein